MGSAGVHWSARVEVSADAGEASRPVKVVPPDAAAAWTDDEALLLAMVRAVALADPSARSATGGRGLAAIGAAEGAGSVSPVDQKTPCAGFS